MSIDGSRTGPPPAVRLGAGLIMLLGAASVARTAYAVTTNLMDDSWGSGARGVFLVLNAVVLAFSVFVVVLGRLVHRGRMWAWVTSLVLMPFVVLAAGLVTFLMVLADGAPWPGAAVVAAALAALVALTAPRGARRFFTATPAPAAPAYPAAPAVWGPGPGR